MPEVITNNLDLWASALLTKSTAGRGSNGKLEAYGIKKLRALILELAVRGKLVPQDPNDEPASVLLERIAKEKARLINEGRIAKKESLPRLSEEEKRFDLPNGWVWARFGEVFELEYGNNLPEAKRTSTGEYPVFGSNGVVGSHDSYCIDKPCIVVGRKGSAGALNLCLNDKCWVTDVAYSVIPPSALDLKFVFKLFHTLGLDNLGKGIKPGLNRNEAYVLPIAIPSLKEQQRIVAKVDELLALCDQLEQQQTNSIEAHQTLVASLLGTLTRVESRQEFNAAWARIASHFDTLFTTEASIDQLKQTILQLAVMGKLVPQDPNDEPASTLLEKIAEEKKRMTEDGLIKKQIPLSPIKDDEKPFTMPDGWECVRFGTVAVIERGGSPRPINSYLTNDPDGLNWIKIGDTDQGGKYITSTSEKIRREGLSKTRMVYPGDFLLTNSMSFGRPYITKIEGCIHDGWLRISPPNTVDKDYLYLLLSSSYIREAFKVAAAGAVVQNLNADKVRELVIPIPPINEQHRIVTKVDELMALCDILKARILDAQATQIHVADAIVEQAVA